MNGSEGVRLIVENGRVRGLIAKQNGAEIELRAGATILATGGFSANPELVRKYIGAHADQCKLRGSKQDTGDGLRMALEVGAKAVNLKYFYGHLISRKALTDDRFWPYPRLDSFVDEGILVDRNGNRFVDEGRGDVAVANELARTNDVTGAALIFDFATWDAAKDDAFSNSVKTPAPNPWLMDNEGDIFHHETIEGLAQKIGVDAASLAGTVEQYNRAVQSSNASSLAVPRTGKPKPLRPPYYGLKVVPGITFTMGGVLVNGRCEALNLEREAYRGVVRRRRHHRRAHGRISRRLHGRLDAGRCDRDSRGRKRGKSQKVGLKIENRGSRIAIFHPLSSILAFKARLWPVQTFCALVLLAVKCLQFRRRPLLPGKVPTPPPPADR